MLRLDKISKIYPTGEALKEVTREVKTGERIGLVGANGSGKTTQFKIIMGEIEPTSGQVIKPPGLKNRLSQPGIRCARREHCPR